MVVQHNISAINANRYYGINNSKLSKSLEKLSSGYAINRAGDNAAGLAVSEKMRAQIAGINQGVTNAQDGISMIQTFEGALTETDSILQRMKTLATQSANGTYDNDVDRVSIQSEFKQLNDELDQIADTDFNGVIVLNGGTMSDGLQAVGEVFDYDNKASQAAAAQKDIQDQIDALKATQPSDVGSDTTKWNSVDDSKYDTATATQLWKDLGLTSDTKSVDVTFTATVADDGTVSYAATSGTDSDGNALTDTQLAKFTAAAVNGGTGVTGKGGFTVTAGGTTGAANAIFDATDLKTGDVVGLTFTGPAAAAKAPANIGFADDSVIATSDGTTSGTDIGLDTTKASVSLGAIKDADMTDAVKKIFDAFDGKAVTTTIAAANTNTNTITSFSLDGNALTLNSKNTVGGADFYVAASAGKLTISSLNAAGNAADKTVLEIDISGMGTSTAAGTVSGTIAIDNYSVPAAGDAPDVKQVAATPNTQAIQDKIDALQAKLDEVAVSVSDSYDKATTSLTYKKDITLQVGARSKDSVNFTFNYESTGIGNLEADLNCTADGLGTSSLSLATQEDANAAIDAIGNAINKVSMVRGTFGAIQNRLEHKIDNLNVTSENLTDAESRIRDTDMATEMMNFTKNQILAQASQSMLAQANQLPQGVLSLLQ
jgi:flagellin